MTGDIVRYATVAERGWPAALDALDAAEAEVARLRAWVKRWLAWRHIALTVETTDALDGKEAP